MIAVPGSFYRYSFTFGAMTLLSHGIRNLFNPLSGLFGTEFLKGVSGVEHIAPFYHAVSNTFIPHLNTLYQTRTEPQFKADLEYLAKQFNFVDPVEFSAAIKNGNAKGMALLSFDDGLVQCFEIVRPILIKMGIPAVFFINPNFIGGSRIFYRYKVGQILYEISFANRSSLQNDISHILKTNGKFKKHLRHSLLALQWEDEQLINECFSYLKLTNWEQHIYMDDIQLDKMLEQGFYFGGHGMDHRSLSHMNSEERVEDVKKSVAFCRENLKQKIQLFAFPFFDYNIPSQFIDYLHGEMAIDLSFGSSGMKIDKHKQNIQRLDMEINRSNTENFIKSSLALQGVRLFAGNSTLKRK